MATKPRPERVSPHLMARRCGLSGHSLEGLATRRTAALIDEILDLERQCRRVSEETSDILYDAVRGLDDRELRRKLLRLRRDVHNDRSPSMPLSDADADRLDRRVGGTRAKLVRQWIEHRLRRDRLTAAGPDLLEEELRQARRRLRELAGHDALRRGLRFASSTLAAEADRYAADPDAGRSRRTRKTELGLLRYVSRAACKPTPFSSFATVRLGSWTPGGAGSGGGGSAGGPRRLVRPNLALVGAWLDGIVAHPEIRPRLRVAVNPVCWRGADTIRFLARRSGTDVRLRGVREEVVTLPVTPVLEWIVRTVRSTPDLTVAGLCRALAGQGARPEAAAGYVDRLLDLGLLECRTCALVPDPLRGLSDFLALIDTPVSRQLRARLAELAAAVEGVAASDRADPAGRGFDRVRHLVDTIFDAVGGQGGRAWQDNLLYEDQILLEDFVAGLGPRAGALEDSVAGPGPSAGALADLDRFLGLAPLFDKNVYYRESLKHFLRTRHPGDNVPVLPLFEEFARAVQQAGVPEPDRGIPAFNPFRLERLERFHQLQTRFQTELRTRFRAELRACAGGGVPEIDLTGGLLTEFAEAVPDFARRPRTYSCFLQLVPAAAGGGLVLNDVLAGPARTFARFLLSGDEEHPVGRRLLRSLRESVAADTYRDGAPAEIRASFGFNANLHPRLTGHAVDYQPEEAPAGGETIPLSELSVRVDGEDVVVTAGDQRVALVDLAMMAPFLLPPLYRFLTQLRETHFLMLKRGSWLDDDADAASATADDADGAGRGGAVSYPRIRCGELVLTRREWRLQVGGLPLREQTDTDFGHYLRVRRWLREAGLPERAYLRSQQIIEALRARPPEAGAARGDLTKPQYIDFTSYLFVRLFERVCRDVTEYLSVEEALPGPYDPEATQDGRVVEYVTEIARD